jgi:hypothetical protein
VFPNSEQLERARQEIAGYRSQRDWAIHLKTMHDDMLRSMKSPPTVAEFMTILQGKLDAISNYHRLVALLKAMRRFAQSLRVEGD